MLASHSIHVDVHLIVAQRQVQGEPECARGGQSSGYPLSKRGTTRAPDEGCCRVHGMSGITSTTRPVSSTPPVIATIDGLICEKDRGSSTAPVVGRRGAH